MPDISILIELSEFYDVDIKEIIDGERKSEYMNEETKEMMDKVVDYTTADKEILITKTRKYSATAGITLIQRYAPIYSLFMKNADAEYNEISDKIKPYLSKDMNVLELACGTGMFTYILADKVNTWKATDFSENMVKEAKTAARRHKVISGLSFSVEDATNLPYEDESFDAVMIANALHIMPNPEKALAEIKRVLKEDGIMFAPTFVHGEGVGFKLRTKFIEFFGFKAFIKPTNDEFKQFIESNGFKVMEYDRVGSKLAPICCMIAKK